jgi:ribosomal protein L7/L12
MFVNKLKCARLAYFAFGLVLAGAGVMARQDTKPSSEPPSTAHNALADTGDVKSAVQSGGASTPTSNGLAKAKSGNFGTRDLHRVLVSAARVADQAKTNRPEPGATPSVGDGPGKDPRSRFIRSKLDEPVAMRFSDETPLDDVLKYIQSSTKSPEMPNGIPVYVDPIGLQEAEKSLTSTVRIDLEGVPLRRTLQLVLKQIGLVYHVEDGMIFITSKESDGPLGPAIHDPRPILEKAAKAERGELDVKEMEELIGQFKAREQVSRLAATNSDDGQFGTSPADSLQEKAAKAERGELSVKEMEDLIEQFKAREQVSRLAAARAASLAAANAEESPEDSLQEKAAKIEQGRLSVDKLSVKEMEELIELFKARDQVRRLAHANSEPSRADSLRLKPAESQGPSQEQMRLLLTELREFIDVIKADRQGKLTPAKPQQIQPGEARRDPKRIQ